MPDPFHLVPDLEEGRGRVDSPERAHPECNYFGTPGNGEGGSGYMKQLCICRWHFAWHVNYSPQIAHEYKSFNLLSQGNRWTLLSIDRSLYTCTFNYWYIVVCQGSWVSSENHLGQHRQPLQKTGACKWTRYSNHGTLTTLLRLHVKWRP